MPYKFNPFTRKPDKTIGNQPSGSFVVEEILTKEEYANGNSGSSQTIDFSNGSNQSIVLTDNCTITITAPTENKAGKITLRVVQDISGSRLITWPAGTKASGGSAPTLSTAANAQDIIVIYYDGATNHVSMGLEDTQVIT